MSKKKSIPYCDLYFPTKVSRNIENIKETVQNLKGLLIKNEKQFNINDIEKFRVFTLDYKILTNNEVEAYLNFKQDFSTNPELILNCLNLAMHQIITEQQPNKEIPPIQVRLLNYSPVLQLKDLNAGHLGKFVSIRGTVIKASSVEIVCNHMAFKCLLCENIEVLNQPNGVYTPLEKCGSCKKKGQNLEALYNSPLTQTGEWQSIVLQENNCDMAKVPETMECRLQQDLVKSCLPGDDITISGIIKVQDPNDNKGKNKQHTLYNTYMQVFGIYNNKNEESGSQNIIFTPEDYSLIRKIHSQPNLYDYLLNSLCPTIYGNTMVKSGLLLSLFGGSKKDLTRSESHILIVGDPGLGKSQMLKSCANVSPRGVYVCGTGSTNSGLTITMTRESGGEYSMEAGALMMADQGCCCIDEFDKMLSSQHACLLEVMEQQSISLAKAGTVCCLPVRPTILVAANPVGGHYDKSKTVAENIKIGSPMLSRFDLVFILLDQPDEELDKHLSNHILAGHSSNLLSKTSFKNSLLSHKTFRKYIAYAQKYVHPSLTSQAKTLLKEFYIELRQEYNNGSRTPVTTRQLQSLIRLTQARAKAELREEATEEDALHVIDIMKHCLKDIFTDGEGCLDTTRSSMGSGMSYKTKVMRIVEILQKRSLSTSQSQFTLQEIKEVAETAGIPKTKFNHALESLNVQGFLLNKGGNVYQLNSAYL
ncbi:hypothetical protein ABEB36_015424 [Hypothenemus hampei]|uniref:DNA helicase MCM8 n=1 Tax=Hypothenemus hampei TaxID=57062 RepID=A0ABD1E0F0_HYPHA